jgi:hypothetical protein
MGAHFRRVHPGFRVPGWPELKGKHSERLSEGDWPIPSESMAELLNYDDGEERRLGVAESSEKWSTVPAEQAKRRAPDEDDGGADVRCLKRVKT